MLISSSLHCCCNVPLRPWDFRCCFELNLSSSGWQIWGSGSQESELGELYTVSWRVGCWFSGTLQVFGGMSINPRFFSWVRVWCFLMLLDVDVFLCCCESLWSLGPWYGYIVELQTFAPPLLPSWDHMEPRIRSWHMVSLWSGFSNQLRVLYWLFIGWHCFVDLIVGTVWNKHVLLLCWLVELPTIQLDDTDVSWALEENSFLLWC